MARPDRGRGIGGRTCRISIGFLIGLAHSQRGWDPIPVWLSVKTGFPCWLCRLLMKGSGIGRAPIGSSTGIRMDLIRWNRIGRQGLLRFPRGSSRIPPCGVFQRKTRRKSVVFFKETIGQRFIFHKKTPMVLLVKRNRHKRNPSSGTTVPDSYYIGREILVQFMKEIKEVVYGKGQIRQVRRLWKVPSG